VKYYEWIENEIYSIREKCEKYYKVKKIGIKKRTIKIRI